MKNDINLCPVCGIAIAPVELDGINGLSSLSKGNYSIRNLDTDPLSDIEIELLALKKKLASYSCIAYSCPSCRRPFLSGSISGKEFIFPLQSATFSSEISDISPEFIEIYNQALQAESLNLNEISGMGYRKALEFLIKDYLINSAGLDRDEVCKNSLGQNVQGIKDATLNSLAKSAVWLGNDQVHYSKKYENVDIETMKKIIEVLVVKIQHDHVAKKAMDFVKTKNPDF